MNQSISLNNGKWNQCHVLSCSGTDVIVKGKLSASTTYTVNSSRQLECEYWVYDHFTFESTIATDVKCVYLYSYLFGVVCAML